MRDAPPQGVRTVEPLVESVLSGLAPAIRGGIDVGPFSESAATVGVALATVLVVGGMLTRVAGGDSDVTVGAVALSNVLDSPFGSTGTDSPAFSEDEQFVVDLLRENDGQLRQSLIVERSEWSKSKVSRLLSSMERQGYVQKVTAGRENVIVLDLPGS